MFKRWFLIAAMLLVAFSSSGCGPQSPAASAPESTSPVASAPNADAEGRDENAGPLSCSCPLWDVGEIDGAEAINHRFTLTNNSDSNVRIAQILTTCGCVITQSPKRELRPGEQVDLPVNFHPASLPGPFQHTITVHVAEPAPQRLQLSIVGFVKPNASLFSSARLIDFGTLKSTDWTSRQIAVHRHDGSPVRFDRLTTSAGSVDLEGEGVPESGGKIAVRFRPDGMNAGRQSFRMTFQTHAEPPYDKLILEGSVVVETPCSPRPSLYLVGMRPGEARRVELFPPDSAGCSIESCHVEGEPRLSVQAVRGGGSAADLVELRVDADDSTQNEAGVLVATIVLKLKDGPQADVPVTVVLDRTTGSDESNGSNE